MKLTDNTIIFTIKNLKLVVTPEPGIAVYVEHWGGGDNLQFYPNFALFKHWGDEARPPFFSRETNMTNVQHAFEQIK